MNHEMGLGQAVDVSDVGIEEFEVTTGPGRHECRVRDAQARGAAGHHDDAPHRPLIEQTPAPGIENRLPEEARTADDKECLAQRRVRQGDTQNPTPRKASIFEAANSSLSRSRPG